MVKNKAPRAYEEAGCDATTGVLRWDDVGATVACDAVARVLDTAAAGCLTGWVRAMARRPRTRPRQSIHCLTEGAVCSTW